VALPHNKVCNVEDFADPVLAATMREVLPHVAARYGAGWPAGREERKHWEVAMAARAFAEHGVLHDRAEVLGVGAGTEHTLFWLTTRVGRVFATDLYSSETAWSEATANAWMLVDPGRAARFPWNPRRLVVQHMDALDLRYEDGSFDAIFSSSSIEHFGGPDEIRRAAAEMHRVLKPGGILSLATEYRLDGPASGMEGTLLFAEADLLDLIVGGLDWEPVDRLDVAVSEATLASEVPFMQALADVQSGRGEWSRYPMLVLRLEAYLWTSVHLALRKGVTARPRLRSLRVPR
jgi:SAM-dependent methyltransferase